MKKILPFLQRVFSFNHLESTKPQMQPNSTSKTNQLSIQGDGNTTLQGIYGSNVTINNITNNTGGLSREPVAHQPTDEFLETLTTVSYKESPLPEYYLFNCDRVKEILNMQDHLKKTKGHQFYFILSSSTQKPSGLVQSYIFDLIDQYEEKLIEYKRDNSIDGTRQMAVKKVKVGREIDWLQRDWLTQIQKNNQSFEVFLKDELPKLNHHYIATAYEFYAKEWPSERFNLLLKEWLHFFSKKTNTGPQCLFFFIVYIESIHCKEKLSSEETELVKCIESLAKPETYKEQTLIIDRLPQVQVQDVNTWLDQMLDGGKRRSLLEIWYKKMYKEYELESGFAPEDKLNMDDVYTFMRQIWSHGRQNRKTI